MLCRDVCLFSRRALSQLRRQLVLFCFIVCCAATGVSSKEWRCRQWCVVGFANEVHRKVAIVQLDQVQLTLKKNLEYSNANNRLYFYTSHYVIICAILKVLVSSCGSQIQTAHLSRWGIRQACRRVSWSVSVLEFDWQCTVFICSVYW